MTEELQKAQNQVEAEGISLLDQIMQETRLKPADDGYETAKKGVEAFIGDLLAPSRKGEKVEQKVVDNMSDPEIAFLNCSYYLLWNWKKLYDDPEKDFRPTDDGGDQLMICDMLLGPENYNGDRWISAHPFKGAEKHQFSDAGTNMSEDYWATDFVFGERPKIRMNAAYLDGRVDSVSSEDYYQWGGDAGIWLLPHPFK